VQRTWYQRFLRFFTPSQNPYEPPDTIFIMFGGSRYFGLTGQRLNLAVGIIAGIDFL
jgi:hypothetical protein